MTMISYADLGWNAFFARQADAESEKPLRIAEVHRSALTAISPDGPDMLRAADETGRLAVGDWVTAIDGVVTQIFDRQSNLKRRASGTDAREQLIAANVTTLGIVTSCNADFNERRIERYLVLAADAGCLPLVILTKADQSDDPDAYVRLTENLSPLLTAIAIDATDPLEIRRLHAWCRSGDTLALVGSSGVGKTTIRNGLTGESAATQGIRENDSKGKHTTTSRSLVRTEAGGWLIDTPGMRALRLSDVTEGIETVFADIEDLAAACRFSDCAHETEPGCQVLAAIQDGTLDHDRMRRWQKLRAEDIRNSETIAEARARDKGFGKMVRKVVQRKKLDRGT
ncbi:MAG: ribosome small subunit-dependent GTPase A [Boseongicola sp.]